MKPNLNFLKNPHIYNKNKIMEKTNIYGLYSTRDEKIRYIGKSNNLKLRLK